MSLWLNVDPLADYNPFYNSEHYIDGEHNDGVYNSYNTNPYIYCYHSPVVLIDPNGKQTWGYGMSSVPANQRQNVVRGMNQTYKPYGQATVYLGAVILDVYVTKGWATRSLVAYEAGSAYHSMEMQSYWRSKGKTTEAKKYEEEGADATKNLSIYGVSAAAGGLLKYKPCGCFISGTQVLTEDGYKNIEDIREGDLVWAYDEKTSDLKAKRVIKTYALNFSQIFKIYIGDEVIEATHEHPFFIGGKWLNADQLKEGDYVTLYDNTTKRIDRINFISKGNFNVYNFEVEDYHSYFVGKNKILVHNGNPCAVSYGSNMLTKFKKHSAEIIGAARKNGIALPKGVSSIETQNAFKGYMQHVVKNGESYVSDYMTVQDAIWSKLGESIVIRKANGEFVTHLTTGTTQGKKLLEHYEQVVSKSTKAIPLTH
ncbi:intein/intein [Chryseobacterium sp. CBTAP 102]|nr:intein/intein [Chryseobacterium sp. CBTAP 102]